MPSNQVAYGMTLRNFVAYPELPDPAGLIEKGEWIEQLGFESAWVWDHILLGVEPHRRLIENQDLRFVHQRLRQADALPIAL